MPRSKVLLCSGNLFKTCCCSVLCHGSTYFWGSVMQPKRQLQPLIKGQNFQVPLLLLRLLLLLLPLHTSCLLAPTDDTSSGLWKSDRLRMLEALGDALDTAPAADVTACRMISFEWQHATVDTTKLACP